MSPSSVSSWMRVASSGSKRGLIVMKEVDYGLNDFGGNMEYHPHESASNGVVSNTCE